MTVETLILIIGSLALIITALVGFIGVRIFKGQDHLSETLTAIHKEYIKLYADVKDEQKHHGERLATLEAK